MAEPLWSVAVRVVDAHLAHPAVVLDVVVRAADLDSARARAQVAASQHCARVEHRRGGEPARDPFGGWVARCLARWSTTVVCAQLVDDAIRPDDVEPAPGREALL